MDSFAREAQAGVGTPREPLVVYQGRSGKAREVVALVASILSVLLLVREGFEEPRPIRVVLLVLLCLILVAFFVLTSASVFSSRPVLVVDEAGLEIGYPIAIGWIPWSAAPEIERFSRLTFVALAIRSDAVSLALQRRSFLLRLVWRLHSGHDLKTVRIPDALLPMPAEDFRAAVESYRPADGPG